MFPASDTGTVAATAITNLDAETTGVVTVNAGITTLTGTIAQVQAAFDANDANTVAGLGDDEAVTLTEVTAAAANLNTLNLETTGVINAATVNTLTGTLAGLKSRLQARGIGFKGEFSDLAGGEAYDKYKTAVGTKEGQVDAYGNPTPIGKQAESAETPVAPTGTTLNLDRIIAQTNEFLDKGDYDINKTEGQVTATTETAQIITVNFSQFITP